MILVERCFFHMILLFVVNRAMQLFNCLHVFFVALEIVMLLVTLVEGCIVVHLILILVAHGFMRLSSCLHSKRSIPPVAVIDGVISSAAADSSVSDSSAISCCAR